MNAKGYIPSGVSISQHLDFHQDGVLYTIILIVNTNLTRICCSINETTLARSEHYSRSNSLNYLSAILCNK